MARMTSDQMTHARAVETAQYALADARRDGDPQAIKVAQQSLVDAQQAQHKGVATPDQHITRSGSGTFAVGGVLTASPLTVDNVAERERQRVANEAELADIEAAADDLACEHIEPGDDVECGVDGPMLFRVRAPERGLDALIPDPGTLVCTTHLPALLCDQNFEDNRVWSVTVVVEPA